MLNKEALETRLEKIWQNLNWRWAIIMGLLFISASLAGSVYGLWAAPVCGAIGAGVGIAFVRDLAELIVDGLEDES